MNGGGVHDKLVVGAAAGVFAGLYHQGTGVGQGALAPAQGVLRQLGRRQIAVHRGGIDDAQLFQSVSFHVLVPPQNVPISLMFPLLILSTGQRQHEYIISFRKREPRFLFPQSLYRRP